MLTLEQISDRLELERLVVDYSNAIDERDFERLDRLFTADAYVDYRAMGGIDGEFPKIKAWLPDALGAFPAYMHFVGNFTFDVHGDEATGRVACINPMSIKNPQGVMDTMLFTFWYRDRYRRTADGWRICERIEEKSCEFNMPEWLKNALAK